MDEQSLIPKKPAVRPQYVSAGLGVFFRLSFIFFLVSLLFAGTLFFYKNVLTNQLADQKETLKKLEVEFEPSLIAELDRVSRSISAARDLVKKHLRQSAIFTLLQENTLPAVTFTSFGYAEEKKSVTLAGDAASYADISAQSTVFESLGSVASARFSNLALKDSGRVSFALSITLK